MKRTKNSKSLAADQRRDTIIAVRVNNHELKTLLKMTKGMGENYVATAVRISALKYAEELK